MANVTDIDLLAEFYDLLQNLMREHSVIDEKLKEISLTENFDELERIENASLAIIETCNAIEKHFSPKKSCCCH